MKDKNTREGLRLVKKLIIDMNDKAKKNKTKLIVALFPTKQAVYNEIINEDKKRNFLFSEIVKNEKIIKKEITDSCEENEISVIDVFFDTVSELKAGNRTYFASEDDHPNENGYKIYAKTINIFLNDIGKQATSSFDVLISSSSDSKLK
jgi:regulator of PEP synthase PpsR (kinase-PPPase family)